MGTDYTPAIEGLVSLVVVLTSMVGFILSRPSDLASTPR